MKKTYYPNCSELIADFNTHNAKEFFEMASSLIKKYKWTVEPSLSLDILEAMKKDNNIQITVVDNKGNYTTIEYGNNGYDRGLGFRFDSNCDHADSNQYNFFDKAIEECQAEIRSYDGGNTVYFKEWQKKHKTVAYKIRKLKE